MTILQSLIRSLNNRFYILPCVSSIIYMYCKTSTCKMPQVNKPAVTEGSSAGGLNFRNFRKSKNVKKHKCVQLSVRSELDLLGFLTVHKQWDSTVYTGLIVQYSLTHHPGCIQYKYSSYMLQVQ